MFAVSIDDVQEKSFFISWHTKKLLAAPKLVTKRKLVEQCTCMHRKLREE